MSWIDPDGPEWAELLSASTARMAAQDAADERAFAKERATITTAGWESPALGIDPSAMRGFEGVTGHVAMFLRGD